MIGVRLNTFNDSTGEPEQDANSALTELDKGLRSGKVGEQCEAIVRFPRLFEKYPFPILINSSFLKLSDVFRIGNNFLRLWVLRVCQQSEKHLDKVLNVDEFLRRIFSVLHSNDPVARALSLRTLGAVAGIIPERQNVHHAIRRGLDSHDNVEVEAAIYATTRFAAHSNAFAVAMCNKLSDMVECENTGAERRAKLVRALRTVHGGAIRAQGVLKLLRTLLEKFPSSSSVRAAISALTAIADDTIVHVPDQVELLLSITMNDPRSTVRRAALLGLKKLSAHSALWPADSIENLVRATDSQDTEHTMLCLQVMALLVECGAVCARAEPLRVHCASAVLSRDLRHAATAAVVLTRILLHCYEENLPAEGSDLMLALESLVIATSLPNGQNNIKPLRTALRCLVQLSTAVPLVYAGRTALLLGGQLRSSSGARELALLEALGALGALPPHPANHITPHGSLPVAPALPALKAKLADKRKRAADSGETSDDGTALVLLCTVIFQERAGTALSCQLSTAWEGTVLDTVRHADGWTRYRIARAALRYGHHKLASELLQRLCSEAPSEAAQRWLRVLHRAALSDHALQQEGISGLEAAHAGWEVCGGVGGYSGGCGAGGAGVGVGVGCSAGCAGCASCRPLQAAWVEARAAALSALARTAAAARALCTQPPPAIAHAHSQASRDPAARAGACAAALRGASGALARAAQRYADIARSAFHADEATLNHLHISQYTYNQLSQFLERITNGSVCERADGWAGGEGSSEEGGMTPRTLDECVALAPSVALRDIADKLFRAAPAHQPITHRHAEAVLAAVRALCAGAVWPRGACGGRAGGAVCRVSVTPAARAGGGGSGAGGTGGGGVGAGSGAHDHAATLPLSHHLALKMEGVVLHQAQIKKKKQREVKGVQLTVTATPHPRTNDKTVELSGVAPVLRAVQTVAPLRDFFSAQQLISVAAPGLYTVAVEAAFVDDKGQLWNTGPRTTIVIKAHEDPTNKSNTQTIRGRF